MTEIDSQRVGHNDGSRSAPCAGYLPSIPTAAVSGDGEASQRSRGRDDAPRLLDLFCGVGGWSTPFIALGWSCVGVDLAELSYPGEFVKSDVRELESSWIDGFDAIVASPPCEEFARAWLPWLRMDKSPAADAVSLLEWAVKLCNRPRRIVECSKFAARHVPGSQMVGSYALWGDVPLLMPHVAAQKERKSGLRPELRAAIPSELATPVAQYFTRQLADTQPTLAACARCSKNETAQADNEKLSDR